MSLFDLYYGKGISKKALGAELSHEDNDVDTDDIEDDVDVDSGSDGDDEYDGYEDDVDTDESSSGEETVVEGSDELDTELLDVEADATEAESEFTKNEEALDEGEEAMIATESMLANLHLHLSLKGGIDALAHESMVARLGEWEDRLGGDGSLLARVEVSSESYANTFSTVGGRQMVTEGMIDSIVDFFKKIVDSILKAIAWILDKGSALMSRLFNNFEKMRTQVSKAKEELGKAKGSLSDDNKEYKSAGIALALNTNGKIIRVDAAAQIIAKVVSEVAGNWGVKELSGTAEEIAKGIENSVEEFGKVVDSSVNELSKDKSNNLFGKGAVGLSKLDKVMKSSLDSGSSLLPKFGGTAISSQEAARCKTKLANTDTAYRSDILPRNKVIITVVTNSSKASKTDLKENKVKFSMYSRLKSYKPQNKDNSIVVKTHSISEMNNALTQIEKTLQLMDHLKRKINSAKPMVSKLKGVIVRMWGKMLAVTKKQRENRGFIHNIRFTKDAINTVKSLIGCLREPGTGLTHYVLHATVGLLKVVFHDAKMYEQKS